MTNNFLFINDVNVNFKRGKDKMKRKLRNKFNNQIPSIRRGAATGAKIGATTFGAINAATGLALAARAKNPKERAAMLKLTALGTPVGAASGALQGSLIGAGTNAVRKRMYLNRNKQ